MNANRQAHYIRQSNRKQETLGPSHGVAQGHCRPGQASVPAQAVGLATISFPETASAGGVYTQSGVYSATVAHTYTFTAGQTGGETASGVYTIAVTDRAGNGAAAFFTVTRDVLAPTTVLTVPQRATTGTIPLSWQATDDVGNPSEWVEASSTHTVTLLPYGLFQCTIHPASSRHGHVPRSPHERWSPRKDRSFSGHRLYR